MRIRLLCRRCIFTKHNRIRRLIFPQRNGAKVPRKGTYRQNNRARHGFAPFLDVTVLSESSNNQLYPVGCNLSHQNILLCTDRHAVRAGHHLQSWKHDTICFHDPCPCWVFAANLPADTAGSCK